MSHETGPSVRRSEIRIREDDSACIVDFGLVSKMAPDSVTALTKTGEMLGTIRYMSPEQFRDARTAGPASDIYSLGATLFHALTGAPPLAEATDMVVALQIIKGRIPRIDAEADGVAPEIVDLVTRLMAADPAERPGSAEAVEHELREAMRALPPTGQRRRRRRDDDTKIPEED